jgi:hypothetical protein
MWIAKTFMREPANLVRCKILQFEAVFHDSLASCTKVRLEVFEQTGIQLRPEIDARFSQFAPHQGRKENTDA